MKSCSIQKVAIPGSLLGMFTELEAVDAEGSQLRSQMENQGYVFIRNALSRDQVMRARSEVFGQLKRMGEITDPVLDGIATGTSRRRELSGNKLGEFWKEVSEGSHLRDVTHGDELHQWASFLLNEPARAHDLLYLRPLVKGKSTQLHYDYPFFAGYAQSMYTAWVPLGDIPMSDGPIALIEKSNQFLDMINPLMGHDYDKSRANELVQHAAYSGAADEHPVDLVRRRKVRILTTDFRAGDLLFFSMLLLHGSLDNQSAVGRTRLSCDVRYQPANETTEDKRYFGRDPSGSKGGGYGDMRGAQPLSESEE